MVQASRPAVFDFGLDTCTLDTNDLVKWEVIPTDDPAIGKVLLMGEPFAKGSFTVIGSVNFKYRESYFSLYKDLTDIVFEAQHPWLDFQDALSKNMILPDKLLMGSLLCQNNGNLFILDTSNFTENLKNINCFKLLACDDWHLAMNVKVYSP
jgi:hypothetical protein